MVPDDRALRYTSRSLLAIEERLLTQLASGALTGTGVLDQRSVESAIVVSTLGDDQAAAIRVLTSAGDRVAVMVGRAGTGKTHTLGTLRAVYEAAGWDVIGLAPSARAAREIQDGAGIVSSTIARHLVEQREITANTLIVIDEAAMAGTRDIAALVDQATRHGAEIVLVGDHRQLPEVSASGAFRAALTTLDGRVVELTVNRRQTQAWEQTALDQLRHGDVATAFAAYLAHDRVIIADNPNDLHKIVLADWTTTRTFGSTVLLAGTRAEAQQLNREARVILAATGELDLTRQIEIASRAFAVGDQVVLGRNHPHQHLTSGVKQLLASAPTDQRQFIDRIVNSALAPTQMHNYLTSVASGQEARRDWIIANWPHIVELEQVTQLIATRQTQPHWPAAQPDPVKTVLDQLRHYAPDVTERENRSLAQLARHQIEHDPVGRLEARHRDLQQLNQHTLSPTEHEALHIELVNNSNEIRAARRAHAAEQAFERYTPNPTDDARTTRITTLAHDTLTTQPTWVINHIRHLHDNHLLADTDTAELATRIITTAAHLDIHGQLPPAWDAPPAPTVHGTQPGIEVG